LSDSERKWPEVERRTSKDRRSGTDRRSETGWLAVPLDERSAISLVEAATQARAKARAPFSRFKVGAALESADGPVHTGCNVENASYSLTICAERVALVKALSEGHTRFTRIAVVADTPEPTPPCGPCRQLLWEYCGDIDVILANLDGPKTQHRLSELLPLPFDRRILKLE
jgi:cytidine deaminase